jgi:hypothetical protein
MAKNTPAAMMAGIGDTSEAVCQNLAVLWDGLGWKPLSIEHDYVAVDRRIKKEIFPEATWFKR